MELESAQIRALNFNFRGHLRCMSSLCVTEVAEMAPKVGILSSNFEQVQPGVHCVTS